jgi:hypothetical protein
MENLEWMRTFAAAKGSPPKSSQKEDFAAHKASLYKSMMLSR